MNILELIVGSIFFALVSVKILEIFELSSNIVTFIKLKNTRLRTHRMRSNENPFHFILRDDIILFFRI